MMDPAFKEFPVLWALVYHNEIAVLRGNIAAHDANTMNLGSA